MDETGTVAISGVQAFRLGDHVIVRVEIDGAWCEVISERIDGAFSHIVEVGGIRKAARTTARLLRSAVSRARAQE